MKLARLVLDRSRSARPLVGAALPFGAALTLWSAACTGAPPAADGCPASSGEGTTHATDVVADEVWRAEDGPHFVGGRVAVRDGATLTIEPCAELRLAEGASLDVGLRDGDERGRLLARGDAERPISVVRAGEGAWSSVAVFAPSQAELAHVRLEGGGSDDLREGASLFVQGTGRAPGDGQVVVERLEVVGSRGPGVVMVGAGRFADGSSDLVIRGSGSFPLVVGQHALGSLPDGDLRGNATDEILVREDLANGFVGLQVDTTVRAASVPFHVGTEDGEPMRIGGSSGQPATLTLEAGVELRFHPGTMLRVLASPEGPVGAVRALGTADAPVRFTSAAADPAAGDWAGLYFESPVSDANEISHAVVEFAGGYCSCTLASCSPVTYSEAAIVIDGEAPGRAFVRDTTIRASGGHGVFRSWLDRADVDFASGNAFEDIAGCAQTMPVLSDVVCPDVDYVCAPE